MNEPTNNEITSEFNLMEFIENYKINIKRTAVDFNHVERQYGLVPAQSFTRKVKKRVALLYECNTLCVVSFFKSIFPIICWLPKYERSFIIPDLIAGFTIAVLHIPQGMAYGVLASLKAENGLYLAIFPVIIYFLLGTSKHISIGTLSIISLMVGSAIEKVNLQSVEHYNFTDSNSTLRSATELPPTNVEIATSLSLAVGFLQLSLGIVQLGTLAVLLSDQLVSGFCTGAACHVATAVIPEIFGITIRRYSGSFKLVYVYNDIFRSISSSNVATIITSAVAIFCLACVKEQVNNRFKDKLKLPIPIDLVVVIIATAVSYLSDFDGKYKMKVIGLIPTGLPVPLLPRIDLVTQVLGDSFAIAIVIFAVSLSMAKIFAKKHGYQISANQELIALGCANMFSSFFYCFPSSSALARSLVQERSGGKTQVASVISTCILLLVVLFLSPFFYTLPRCILSAIILVALKGMFLQVNEFFKAWKVAKIDAMIWLVTMLSTVLLDVTLGLLVGVIFSIFTVILRTAFPVAAVLGNVEDTDLYLDVNKFEEAKEIKGIKIFRFESALYFVNRDSFKNTLQKHVPFIVCDSGESQRAFTANDKIHHIIIDCSSFSYIDLAGLEMLDDIKREYNELGITVFLAGCSVTMWNIIKRKKIFNNQSLVFPTIHDAIQYCIEN